MAVAWFMAKRPVPPRFRDLLQALVIIFIPTILILKQPDLGTSILISTSGLLVLFFAGMSWLLIFSMIGIVAAMAPVMWFFVMHAYQKQRVLTFLNPEFRTLLAQAGILFNPKRRLVQAAFMARATCRVLSRNLSFCLRATPTFIIAVLAEEHGLIGVCLLLALYALIILRCLYISSRCETLFGRLLSGSMSVTFFIYVFVNIGMVSGILPVVGVPLPLVSYGGTSVVSLLLGFGLIMSMYTHRQKEITGFLVC